jgi:uncharacterized membrane protein
VLALLRNPQYCVYGASAAAAVPGGVDGAERAFNAASLEERGKFSAETLSNVGGVRRSAAKAAAAGAGDGTDELVVITLLVAVEGPLALPSIGSVADLQAALRALGSVGAERLVGVELLWTPQAEGDTFSRDQIAADYPLLASL